jgi:WS/DGAT/MGAT family acyltransferase
VEKHDRQSGLDSLFLHLEDDATHMHVAACAVFEGRPPSYEQLVDAISERLHLVPRYRQRLVHVPLDQGRPVWVDDPHFHVNYHVRHTALPRPGGDEQLKRLAGRVFSHALDRSRALWEIWLVEGVDENRFALLTKTHHALVDGVSGVDIATVLFDASPDPLPAAQPARPWDARPLPSSSQLLAEALLERANIPREVARGVRAAIRGPRQVIGKVGGTLAGLGATTSAGLRMAPDTPFNVQIGPHRRFTWVTAELAEFKAIRQALGGTVNDVVLTVVAGGLGRYMRLHGHNTDNVSLRVMVPISIRTDLEQGALGNRVSAMWVPLPVGLADPVDTFTEIGAATASIKESGQAVGANVLTGLSGHAPSTIVHQAARLQARQRLFNLVVTNVPGPQRPLYLLGRELQAIYPMVPLAKNTALGIAIMSYNGQLDFGLVSDYDALADLEAIAGELQASLEELSAVALTGAAAADAPRRSGSRSTT